MKRLKSLTVGDRFMYRKALYTYLKTGQFGDVFCREHLNASRTLGVMGYGKFDRKVCFSGNILVEFVPV
jgi:hypothetical protein